MDSGGWMLVVVFFACLNCAALQASGVTCSCEYIEQPPNGLQCDPYQNSKLVLECTTLFLASQTSKSIVWFHSQLQSPNREAKDTGSDSDLDLWQIGRLTGLQPGIHIREQNMQTLDGQNMLTRSQLVISDLNDSHVGNYWCRIKDGNNGLIPSDSVYLQQASAYSHFGACSQQFAQSKQERKCAGWVTMVTPSENATTEPLVYADGTTVPSSTEEDIFSAYPSTEDLDDKDSKAQSLTTELYIAISILVLFSVMVLIFTPAILCMCAKKRKQGRHRRPDLGRLHSVNLQKQSTTMPAIASDYLLPQSGLAQEQLQLPRYSCETIQGLNHDYERVEEVISEHNSNPDYTNMNTSTLIMKRNEAYRARESNERHKRKVEVEILDEPCTRDKVLPDPLYEQTASGEDRLSTNSSEYIDMTGNPYL